ncbi:MAG TPA: hypothetical protein VG889_21240 [Rhizomicrobium sp.]|nr:hypothetical protein [Rhizomicrobium sp.]
MRKFGLLLVSVAGLAICGTAAMADAAQPASDATQAASTTNDSDLDKIVCRSMGAPTGSRLGARRECKTQREWDDIRRQNEKEVSKMQARDSLSPQGH